MTTTATLLAGIPATNMNLLHKTGFPVGDPAAFITISKSAGNQEQVFVVRDIEAPRAQQALPAARVLTPEQANQNQSQLPGDRELATAISVANFLLGASVERVTADRTLSLCFVDAIRSVGIPVELDPDLGIRERRSKSPAEIENLSRAQRVTEQAIEMICGTIANASANSSGALESGGEPVTTESLSSLARAFLIDKGYEPGPMIIASGTQSGDCHERGAGVIHTEQPVIVDVFPTEVTTHFVGDCTRTVVHGEVPPRVAELHAAVKTAKADAMRAVRAGVPAHEVHMTTVESLKKNGFSSTLPDENEPGRATMPHGTGHGVGLEVHELPLIDVNGLPLVENDAVTIEPGLYQPNLGGVRIEDVVIVTKDGCENLNTLHEELDWSA